MNRQPGVNRPDWKAENDHPELSANLKKGLEGVVDPEIDLNVIDLGLIREVIIEPDKAIIEMILTTPYCPYGPAMIEMVREKAEQVLNRPVSMQLGMEVWDPSMMAEGLADDWGLY